MNPKKRKVQKGYLLSEPLLVNIFFFPYSVSFIDVYPLIISIRFSLLFRPRIKGHCQLHQFLSPLYSDSNHDCRSECFVLWPFQLLRHLNRKHLHMVSHFDLNIIDFSLPIFTRFFVCQAFCIILITTHDITQVIYLVYSIMLNIFSLRVVFPICQTVCHNTMICPDLDVSTN